MADPYYCLDIPRVVASYRASLNRRVPKRLTPAQDDARVEWLLLHLGDKCRTRGDKAALRDAAHIIIRLLDGTSCPRSHCDKWGSSHPFDCAEERNPKKCPICKKYLAKRAEREAKAAGGVS